MPTAKELKALNDRFDAEHVWAYVQIAQSNGPPKTVPALRMGLFAVTKLYFDGDYDDDYPSGAKITHLPSGIALGSFVHGDHYKAYIADLASLGEEANTLSVAKMAELFAPIAIKHGIIDEPKMNHELPEQAQPLNGAAS